jgi:hypothetical protein
MKKYATMYERGAAVVTANSKKEAAQKLNVSVKKVYRFDK